MSGAAKKRGTAMVGLHVSDGTVSVPVTITVKVGNRKANVMGGTSGADLIFGRGGNDRVRGLGGNDLLCGGKGRDKLAGGDGRDILDGEGTDVATDFNAARGDTKEGTIT